MSHQRHGGESKFKQERREEVLWFDAHGAWVGRGPWAGAYKGLCPYMHSASPPQGRYLRNDHPSYVYCTACLYLKEPSVSFSPSLDHFSLILPV